VASAAHFALVVVSNPGRRVRFFLALGCPSFQHGRVPQRGRPFCPVPFYRPCQYCILIVGVPTRAARLVWRDLRKERLSKKFERHSRVTYVPTHMRIYCDFHEGLWKTRSRGATLSSAGLRQSRTGIRHQRSQWHSRSRLTAGCTSA